MATPSICGCRRPRARRAALHLVFCGRRKSAGRSGHRRCGGATRHSSRRAVGNDPAAIISPRACSTSTSSAGGSSDDRFSLAIAWIACDLCSGWGPTHRRLVHHERGWICYAWAAPPALEAFDSVSSGFSSPAPFAFAAAAADGTGLRAPETAHLGDELSNAWASCRHRRARRPAVAQHQLRRDGVVLTSWPPIDTRPRSGSVAGDHLHVVDLPAPLGPKAQHFPLVARRRGRNGGTAAEVLGHSLISIMAVVGGLPDRTVKPHFP